MLLNTSLLIGGGGNILRAVVVTACRRKWEFFNGTPQREDNLKDTALEVLSCISIILRLFCKKASISWLVSLYLHG